MVQLNSLEAFSTILYALDDNQYDLANKLNTIIVNAIIQKREDRVIEDELLVSHSDYDLFSNVKQQLKKTI